MDTEQMPLAPDPNTAQPQPTPTPPNRPRLADQILDFAARIDDLENALAQAPAQPQPTDAPLPPTDRDAIQRLLGYLAAKQLAQTTRDQRQSNAERYIRWCRQHGHEPLDGQYDVISQHLKERSRNLITGEPNADNTRDKIHTAVNNLLAANDRPPVPNPKPERASSASIRMSSTPKA